MRIIEQHYFIKRVSAYVQIQRWSPDRLLHRMTTFYFIVMLRYIICLVTRREARGKATKDIGRGSKSLAEKVNPLKLKNKCKRLIDWQFKNNVDNRGKFCPWPIFLYISSIPINFHDVQNLKKKLCIWDAILPKCMFYLFFYQTVLNSRNFIQLSN